MKQHLLPLTATDEGQSIDGATTRRAILKTGVAVLGAGAAGLASVRLGVTALALDATASAGAATATACVLTPEWTEGPYYVAGELIRSDITEGRPGVPLKLRIAVQDVTSCGPLANGAVELWHCDAQGYYSGIAGENPGGGGTAAGQENSHTTFLRGVQLTGADGTVEFATIYPGWYTGRTVHIHMKVHVGGAGGAAAVDAKAAATPIGGQTYQGGHTAHTGQLFFDDAISNQVFATEAYARSSNRGHITNAQDNILDGHADEPGFLVALTGSVDQGFVGTIALGVDPSAVATASGQSGGPGGGPPGGPGGSPPSGA